MDEPIAKVIGANIKRFIEERSLNAERLSALADVSIGAIQKWVRGVQAPRAAELAKVAAALGRDVGDFYKKQPPPPRPLDVPAYAAKALVDDIDDDLRAEMDAFVRNINRRYMERVHSHKKKGPPQKR